MAVRIANTVAPSSIDLKRFTQGEQRDLATSIAQKNNGVLTMQSLRDSIRVAEGTDPTLAGKLRELVASLNQDKPAGTFSSEAELRAADAKARAAEAKMAAECEALIKRYVLGQDHAAKMFSNIKVAFENRRERLPYAVCEVGPPGVGKTEMGRGVAACFHGDPTKFITVNCGQFQSKEDVAVLVGSAPGLVGSTSTADISPISQEKIDAMYGEKRPIVILFDELDKMSAAGEEAFWATMQQALEKGKLDLKNGTSVDLRDCVFMFSSNRGWANAGDRTGDALRNHFMAETKKTIPDYIIRRIANFVAFDRLSLQTRVDIVKLMMTEVFKGVTDEYKAKGTHFGLKIADEVAKFIAELADHPQYGAGPLKNLRRQILDPIANRMGKIANDEFWYELRLSGAPGPERDKLLSAIDKAFHDRVLPGIPDEYDTGNFPVEFQVLAGKPKMQSYGGNVPTDTAAPPIVHASGQIGSRGFMIMNKDVPGSTNELFILRAGASEAADVWAPVALPKEIAEANLGVSAVAIDAQRMLIVASTIGADDKAKSFAYVYDATTGACTSVAAPPKVLHGAALASIGDGDAVFAGGRELKKLPEGWNVTPTSTLADLNGVATSDVIYRFDGKTSTWATSKANLSSGRSGLAPVAVDGKIWFVGGEEVFTPPNELPRSRASDKVDVYDPSADKLAAGPTLQSGLAYSTAFVDRFGRITAQGGVGYLNAGREQTMRNVILRFDPQISGAKWKDSDKDVLPGDGAQMAIVPHVAGMVVGPMFMSDGTFEFQILR